MFWDDSDTILEMLFYRRIIKCNYSQLDILIYILINKLQKLWNETEYYKRKQLLLYFD